MVAALWWLLWIACGVASYGTVTAMWMAEWKEDSARDAAGLAAFVACGGPFGLVAAMFLSNFWQHGWRVK